MNKQEFLEEVGRLAERLFPEEYSPAWWKQQLLLRDLPSHVEANRDVIEHWVNGGKVWCDGVPVRADDSLFTAPRQTLSLTDPSLPKPRKYRPWTWEDRGLVPDELFVKQAVAQTARRVTIEISRGGVGSCFPDGGGGFRSWSWDELLEHFTQLDGSPCGVEVSE